MKKIAFLDRDGVLNLDLGYVCSQDRFSWVEGALEAVKFLHEAGYLVVIVTNQSGIGRGKYSDWEFLAFSGWMGNQILEFGGRIERTYYCPHVDEDGCECRKPKPGMILAALEETGADPARSFLIGDKETDLQAAQAAGVDGYLFTGGSLREFASRVLEERAQVS